MNRGAWRSLVHRVAKNRTQLSNTQTHTHTHAKSWKHLIHTNRSYSTFKVRRDGSEEIPLVQGKEQQLRFAGAAMKRYSTSKVRETQVRW